MPVVATCLVTLFVGISYYYFIHSRKLFRLCLNRALHLQRLTEPCPYIYNLKHEISNTWKNYLVTRKKSYALLLVSLVLARFN